jgi:glycerol uptake operon antiterminator
MIFFKKNTVIPAVRDINDYDEALNSKMASIFLLGGSLVELKDLHERAKEYSKKLIVNVDLVSGIAIDKKGIEYLKKNDMCDGIISTRNTVIQAAKKFDFFTIQRVFLIDSSSLNALKNVIINTKPDMIEILPSVAAPFFLEIYKNINTKIIAGGLIRNKEEINELFSNGVYAVSTSKKDLWK